MTEAASFGAADELILLGRHRIVLQYLVPSSNSPHERAD